MKLEQLTYCFKLFFKFLKKRIALIRTYTTPLLCFQTKVKKVQQVIVKNPENFVNKTKRNIKKILMILRKNIQLSQNFIQRNQTDLLVVIVKNQVFRKMFLSILKNMVMHLFSIMVLCQIKIGGLDFYRVIHNLGYYQFADIINKLSFDKLNFDKFLHWKKLFLLQISMLRRRGEKR